MSCNVKKSGKGAYSSYKAAHHRGMLDKMGRGEMVYPTQVQIDLTNKCNHRCPYCFYRCARNETLNSLFNEDDEIPTERLLALIDEFAVLGIPSVQYTGGGEPHMHHDFHKILERTIENDLEFAVVTNGGMLELDYTHLWQHATWLRVSLDAATPAMHKRSQGLDSLEYDEIISKVAVLVKECPSVVIGLSFVVNPMNYREITKATQDAKDLGVNNIRFSVAYTPRGVDLYRNKWREIEALAQEAKKLEDKKFKVFDLINAHLENLDLKHKGYSFCGYQYFTAVIGADEEVYPCCTLKYNELGKLGSIRDKTFQEIWEGPKRQAWLDQEYLKNVCDKNPCWMDKKNEFIAYLISQEPDHKNYI